ncbi:MAG: tRNA (adenosine(37)-N6)-dimethylallyltransferase MiaA [Terriglobales bacterium]
MEHEPLLVVIVGPTASGKTVLSLAIGERFGGEIVNCDSVAVYRDFEIGTAKPTAEERARVPHHLLDLISPTDLMTAGEYARRARHLLNEIKHRGRLPIVVGGTGLYLRALLEGLAEGPQRSEAIRSRLRGILHRRGTQWLHRMLRRFDPAAAGRIHPNDVPKVVRALEVCISAQRPITAVWQQGREPLRGFRILRLGLDPDRNDLYTRINRRAERMFEAGMIEETARLLAKYGDAARPLSASGYKQVVQHLRGSINRKTAVWAAQQAHRNYAKRQMTWFRREPDVHWFKGFGDEPEVQRGAMELVEKKLKADHGFPRI